jgi:hypothetical protein
MKSVRVSVLSDEGEFSVLSSKGVTMGVLDVSDITVKHMIRLCLEYRIQYSSTK